jgi:hypothetical protein
MMIRQGDVLLAKVRNRSLATAKAVPRIDGRVVLALGEATGHAHVIVEPALAELFEERDGRLYLRVTASCELRHVESLGSMRPSGEHDAVTLAPGLYERHPQREYTPAEIRRVAD